MYLNRLILIYFCLLVLSCDEEKYISYDEIFQYAIDYKIKSYNSTAFTNTNFKVLNQKLNRGTHDVLKDAFWLDELKKSRFQPEFSTENIVDKCAAINTSCRIFKYDETQITDQSYFERLIYFSDCFESDGNFYCIVTIDRHSMICVKFNQYEVMELKLMEY